MVPLSLVTGHVVPALSPEPASEPSSRPSSVDPLVEVLIAEHSDIARSMAHRYRNRGVDVDDLEQVALLGLVKAAQRFDPDAGHEFLSFAVPTVRGELRRHFRDRGWTVRPPRRVQELQARVGAAQDELAAELGRSPRPSEVAERLDVPRAEVVEALAADGCFTPSSLDAPVGAGTSSLGELLGDDDREIARVEARLVLAPLLECLSERDRMILRLRYRDELTQQEIADVVGLTQAQVSRILTRLLAGMRADLEQPSAA